MKKLNLSFFEFDNLGNRLDIIKNSSILSFPSFLGIFFALIAIPIHLQINGKADYGNYIFFHFIFSFGLLLNLGINKITTIELAKKKNIEQIINQSLNYTAKIILFVWIISLFISLFFLEIKIFIIFSTGICLTIMYFTLEGILQGFKNFKLLSIVNFIFFTLSINIPSILLLFLNKYDFTTLILISILIKFSSIFIILYYLKKYLFVAKNKKYNFSIKIKKFSKWYFLHFLNIQIYDFMDKYLIKLFLGPVSLAIYSIPYQLAGKITILSKSIAAVLLPDISLGNENKNFNYSINFYVFITPLIILGFYPILNELLILWLKNQSTNEILNLTKVFLITAWLSGISHILISYFEGKKNIRFNTLLEIKFIIPFLIFLLLILMNYKNLVLISFILLFKELVLFILRANKIKNKINCLNFIYINIIIVSINSIVSVYYYEYFLYSYLSLIFFNFLFLVKRLIK